MLQHVVLAFLIAAVLSPFSYYAGKVANKLRLPQITGYLVSGIICGPYVLGILNQESVADLSILEGACLGVIGLAAGAELQLSELNRSKKQVVSLTAGICVMTWLLCYYAIRWSASLTPVLPAFSGGHLTAVASLGATLMMARSPASAIAVMKEMDAQGPFVSLVMGVVVLKDVVVIVLFALNMELVPMIINHQSSGFGWVQLVLPLLGVGVSVSAGLLGGFIISLALQMHVQNRIAAAIMEAWRLNGVASPAVLVTRCKQLLVLLSCTSIFSITRSLEAEPLLACVTAGMVLANRRPAGADASLEDLQGLINSIMTVTNVAFFGLAGASLKLAAIADSVWVALVVFFLRLAAIRSGSWLGCYAGAVKSELHQQYFWMSMVTQAGVAMGLARIAGTAFDDWGPAFQTVMMAIIMLNMLAGPPFFRAALIMVGEARAHHLPSAGHQSLHRDQSVAPESAVRASGHTAFAQQAIATSRSLSGQLQVQLGHVALPMANILAAGKTGTASVEISRVPSEEYTNHVVVSSGALLSDLITEKRHARDSSD